MGRKWTSHRISLPRNTSYRQFNWLKCPKMLVSLFSNVRTAFGVSAKEILALFLEW